MKRIIFRNLIAASAVLCAMSSAQATQLYHVADLGTLGGLQSFAAAINSSGDIVGESTPSSGGLHAYLYHAGTMANLGTLPGGSTSNALAINSAGQVVGESQTASLGAVHAFLYDGSTMTDLGTLGGTHISAKGINDFGQIVGSSSKSGSSLNHAFLYSGGVMSDLGTLGGVSSNANAINGSGQTVGDSTTASGADHAFLYSAGKMSDLNTIGSSSAAFGINASGLIVGYLTPTGGLHHAFLYTGTPGNGGAMADLGNAIGGQFSEAYSINSSGQIVGAETLPGDSVLHAFLYMGGTMYDLNDLVDESGAGLVLDHARSINDNGLIAATAKVGGFEHAFLLTPVPEPPALLTAAIAFLCAATFRKHSSATC